ncbi:Transcription elongation factor SPT5 [Rhynchospora pubera]|uniref:Transcription elongation factor SPT5 n=1 Tax=Rhynchospora pubera TaxID=906938 RepID=A0AAV8CYV3_9POAL|nr:Transcription elongation factor SPT5 [Rhynchospora pubera]
MVRGDYDQRAELRDVEEEDGEEVVDERGGRRRRRKRVGKRVVRRGGGVRDESEEDEEDEDWGGCKRKKPCAMSFIDFEAEVDDDEEEEDEEGDEHDFIDEGTHLENEPQQRMHRPTFIADEHEDLDEIERRVKEHYSRTDNVDYSEDPDEMEQQALLPTFSDPKLWLVKCAIGHERELAVCLMQRCMDRGFRICSVVALDHLKNYIYVEADKLADVKEACKGLKNISSSRDPEIVPIGEMTTVVSVEGKILDIARGSWVSMRRTDYKGDLAQVVNIDDVNRQVTVKLIPRLDLQYLSDKSAAKERGEVLEKKTFVPPPRLFKIDEARKFKNIKVYNKRDSTLGAEFIIVEVTSSPQLMFKDGFLYKKVSTTSISITNVEPTFSELEKFKGPDNEVSGDTVNLSALSASCKKGQFMKGDAVIVVHGDLKHLEGLVQKVDGDIVHIRPKIEGLQETLSLNEKDICKFFKPGESIKVISGVLEGATGTVVKVDGRVLTVLSNTNKEHTMQCRAVILQYLYRKLEDFELYDLVQLMDRTFGLIIRIESEGLEILQGVPDRPKIRFVNLREIQHKIFRRTSAKDKLNNTISSKDIVRVIDGPLKGRKGSLEHIHNGMLFIHDPYHLEHAGFICARAQSCLLVGGSKHGIGGDRSVVPRPPSSYFRGPFPRAAPSQFSRGSSDGGSQRNRNDLLGKLVKVKIGPYKGHRGRVVACKGETVRVELESLMKSANFAKGQIVEADSSPAPLWDAKSWHDARTPIHQSRTPLRPMQTSMRDDGAMTAHGSGWC